MADALQAGDAYLTDMLYERAATECVYCRGADEVSIKATIGQSEMPAELIGDEAGTVYVRTADFIVKATLLSLNGESIEPQKGDRIRVTLGGNAGTYEVLAVGGQQPWRWSGPFKTRMRIHTAQVDGNG